MLRYLLVALLVPFLDLWLLFQVTGVIGLGRTVVLVALTGIIGLMFVKKEIGEVLQRLGTSVSVGEASRNFLEAALLVLAGLLLITPGLITDAAGFIIAARPARQRLAVRLASKFENSDFRFEIHRF